jgi:hypothetical protein
MTGFVTFWVSGALGTFLWLVLTESLLIKLRGAAYFMQIKKALGDTKDSGWVKNALHLLLFWWLLLLFWIWGAAKGRGYLEHMVWLRQDTERRKQERHQKQKERIENQLEKLRDTFASTA